MPDIISGIGKKVSDLFSFNKRPDEVRDKGQKPVPPDSLGFETAERIRKIALKYHQQGVYEKTPFSRKWSRNTLMFQGYHDLEWSDSRQMWDADSDYNDYAYPNNQYRSRILYAVSLYLKNDPQFIISPISDDYEAHAVAKAAKSALEIIKKNVSYEKMRATEAEYLHLYGNSFRYSYYSLDDRYGFSYEPIYTQQDVPTGEADEMGNPISMPVPVQTGTIQYPRGQELTEVVNPMEVCVRIASRDLKDSPYLTRSRYVDRRRLESMYGVRINAGDNGPDNQSTYLNLISGTSGDLLEPGQWYSRAMNEDNVLLTQVWVRPSLYSDDNELAKKFPEGLYAEIVGNQLITTRNESIDDHWVMIPFIHVPGRIYGDGDDDAIPKQLQLNATEQMITKNIDYNAVPKLVIDKMKIDPEKIENDPAATIVAKNVGARPVSDAWSVIPGIPLSAEVHVWRENIKTDMDYLMRVFGSAIGEHQTGVDTLGGQQMFASRTESNLTPMYLTYKEANEDWAQQVLKIAAENWMDDRVHAVMGINGKWEFEKLRGAALNMDHIQIDARIIPVDWEQQQAFTQAVATGLLDPTDPRVSRKAIELFGLPPELDRFDMDAKTQWKEIEKMKQGQPVQAVPFVHNDDIHIEICRIYLNSDEAEDDPQASAIVYQHLLEHIKNKVTLSMMMPTQQLGSQGNPQQVPQNQNGQQQPKPGQQGGGQGSNNGNQNANPKSPRQPESAGQKAKRKNRAVKGQAARSNKQPSSGNQHGR